MEQQVTPEVLAAALRCSAAEEVAEAHCETCPYYVVEDLSGEDAALFGERYVSCDVDRMALDAAAMIEGFSSGWHWTRRAKAEELSGRGV